MFFSSTVLFLEILFFGFVFAADSQETIVDNIGLAAKSAGASEAEKYAAFPADMATLHLAMYDAAMAIERRYRPFLFAPAQVDAGASVSARAAASACPRSTVRPIAPPRG